MKMKFSKARKLLESTGYKIVKENSSEPYWVVRYEDPDEGYSESTEEVPYSAAKTPAEAYWKAMESIHAAGDDDEMLSCYEDEGFDNIEDLRDAVIRYAETGKQDENTPSCCDFTFLGAKLVKDV